MNDLQSQSLDICRAGLAAAVDMMAATVEGAERLRTHQLAAINQMFAENAELATRINDTKSAEDLMAVYAALAGSQFRSLLVYWNGIQRVVSENQAALQNRVQAQSMEMQRHLAQSLEVAVNGGPEPVVEAVKATVTAISTGLSVLARATAEGVKLAAAQAAATNADIQPAATQTMERTARGSAGQAEG
jgi:hypothetical protein